MPPVTGALWAEIQGNRGTGVAGIFGACALYVALALVLVCVSYPLNRTPVGVDSAPGMH